MSASDSEKDKKNTLLTEEQLDAAAKQIEFDLGVSYDRAMEFAKEAQKELFYERDDLVTRETVVTVADTKHLPDDDVPAELVPRDQGTRAFFGENLVKGVVNMAKKSYEKVKN